VTRRLIARSLMHNGVRQPQRPLRQRKTLLIAAPVSLLP
jgi:hypothetical protein